MIKSSDYITGDGEVSAGYLTTSNGVITLHDITNSSTSTVDKLYIPDTGMPEPEYEGSSSGGGSTEFYKCASVDTTNHTWTGYKLTPNADNGFSFASTATAVGEYYVIPTVDKIYDPTGKLKLDTYYGGDTYDPYGNGLLYSIFINGGTGVSAPSEEIVTTDSNYSSNIQTVNGITCRRFSANEVVTTTAGTNRSTWSYSVWLRQIDWGNAINGTSGLLGISFENSGAKYAISSGNSYLTQIETTTAWHHYVITYNGTQANIYQDEALAYSTNVSLGTLGGFSFGNGSSINGKYNGYIANFRFYDHVLTSSEIAALYAELTPTSN